MVVARLTASVIAQGIFQAPFIVQHFVDKPFVQKRLKCPVNGYPVQCVADLVFNVTMRKRVFFLQEKMQYLLAGGGGPELEIL